MLTENCLTKRRWIDTVDKKPRPIRYVEDFNRKKYISLDDVISWLTESIALANPETDWVPKYRHATEIMVELRDSVLEER